MENKIYKISIDGQEKNIVDENDRTTLEDIFKKYDTDMLTTKTVGEICNGKLNFYIPNYQRGYRWGKDEVEALLNDIYEVCQNGKKNERYCLQPLVVKKRNNCAYSATLSDNGIEEEEGKSLFEECYELLDGQQRLTTIWLILSALSQEKKYQIYYELLRPIDKDFIKKAKEKIDEWTKEKNLEKDKYCNTILDKLTFIWYEVISSENGTEEDKEKNGESESLFRKINKGKIELTNAELFKAMLLNDENAKTEENQRELEQISFEWDKIEQSLRNDDFWFFISNDLSEERTRIDYILEVYARGLKQKIEEIKNQELEKIKKKEIKKWKEEREYFYEEYITYFDRLDINKDRYSFLAVSKYLEYCQEAKNGLSLAHIWEKIVTVHDKLYSWYQDNELYHNIGFLVANEGKRKSVASDIIVSLYQKGKDKGIEEVKGIVKGEIYDRLIIKKKIWDIDKSEKYDLETLNYDDDKKYLANGLLLYSNIFPLLEKGRARFPFKLYYADSWDIEHINPQTKEDDIAKLLSWKISQSGDKSEDSKDWVRNAELILQYLEEKNPKATESALPELKENYKEKGFEEFQKTNFGKGFLEELKKAWNSKTDNNKKPDDKKADDQKIDDISNLVLLNSKINRSYHNALFNQKRATIIEYDKSGYFIPIATKNVFLKYYTKNPTDFIVWGEEDRGGYYDYLRGIFETVDGWSQHSQRAKKEDSNE